MAATFISAEAVISGGAANAADNPLSTSITVPSGCTGVYVSYAKWPGGITSATLAGNAPTGSLALAASGDMAAAGYLFWANPGIGSNALVINWASGPTDGPSVFATYVSGGDLTTGYRNRNAVAGEAGQLSFNLTTVAGDLVIAHDHRYAPTGTVPANTSGWTSGQTLSSATREAGARLKYIVAAGTSQAVVSEDEDYSALVGIAIPAAGGGGSIAHILAGYIQMLRNA